MINTIVLDIGNVLAHFRWKEYLQDCGYEEEIKKRVADATIHSNRWRELDRGVVGEDVLMAECIEQDPGVEKEIRTIFQDIVELVKEYDFSADFVQDLKKNGYKVYLLSNFSKKLFEIDQHIFRFLNYVDGGIISYKVKHIKPEPEIYQELINTYDINPTEAVFLDDLQENLEGAKKFGFHTIQVYDHEQALEDLRNLGVRI